MASTTNRSDAKTGWTRLCASEQFAPHLGAAHSIQTDSGTLTVLEPNGGTTHTLASKPAFCAVFPGYTGDATFHTAFISAALAAGLGVVAVNPKWGDSTRRMRENTESLLSTLANGSGPIGTEQVRFIRGVSFGAYLAFSWIERLKNQISKVALITPCSTAQLPAAGKLMGINVHNDDGSRSLLLPRSATVRLLALTHDPVVPDVDMIFMSVAEAVHFIKLDGSDHFTAGDLPPASTEIAKWFAT